jgi:HEAT repeat protein
MAARLLVAAGVAAALAAGGWELSRVRAGRAEVEALASTPAAQSPDDVRRGLASPDFGERLAARRRIQDLPADERLALLGELAAERDPAVRLLVVGALGADRDRPQARAVLERLGRDADADVRAAAAEALAGAGP